MTITDENALNIYTDGSSYSKPRIGGFAVRFVWVNENGNDEQYNDIPQGLTGATNQQMELQACIHALRLVYKGKIPIDASKVAKIAFYTDSKYITENINRAIYEWSRNHWIKRDGNPVINTPQWKELVGLVSKVGKRVEFSWIKGHSKDQNNKAVDKMAKESAKSRTKKRISIVNVRRKKSTKSTEIGSVKMQSQKCTIYIIQDEYLRLQKMYRYRFEVTSKSNPFYRCVDFAYSNILLNAGHKYFVLFNNNQNAPRIIKMYKELPK